jgi:hypothetical protein
MTKLIAAFGKFANALVIGHCESTGYMLEAALLLVQYSIQEITCFDAY